MNAIIEAAFLNGNIAGLADPGFWPQRFRAENGAFPFLLTAQFTLPPFPIVVTW